jgi:nicotinamide-nucleotide adenylyltransferase
VRFFDPRFYQATEGGMDGAFSTFFNDEGSTLVSARRGDEKDRRTEESLLKREEVDKWIQNGSVRLMGEGHEEWVSMSSTKIRKAVAAGDWVQVDKLTIPSIREYIQQEGLYSNA